MRARFAFRFLSARGLSLVGILSLLPSCYLFSPNTDPPAQVEQCGPSGTAGDKSKTREVALGDGVGSGFVPYKDGATVTLVTGGQGLSMVTPVVRVKAESGDVSGTCLFISILSENAAAPTGGGGAGGAGGTGPVGGAGGATGSSSGSGASSGGECFDGDCEPLTITQGATMKLDGDYLYTDGVLYNPVSWESVRLSLTVKGVDFAGTSTVEIHPQ